MEASNLIILAIDDNQDNLTTLQAVVSDRLPGAKVLTALNGKAGLELARAEDPDVILLDVVMPVMDGYEVCRKLKADAQLQGIPVLFLTALRTDLASRIAAMDAGAEGFLSKPFDEIELFAQIRAMTKIKAANRHEKREKDELTALVTQRTVQLVQELAERRKAEKSLRASEERYRTVADFTHDWEYWLAPDGSLSYVSPSCERITGYRAEEFQLDPGLMNRIVHPDDRDLVASHVGDYERVMADSASHEIEFRILVRAGEERWIGHVCRRVHGRAGEYLGRRASNRDITERKRLAEEKTHLEDQLRQSQKVEAIGTLAGGVAHDFNNLTAIVLGYGELLLGRLGPEDPSRRMVEQIVAAGKRSAALTRQLLAFGRRQTLQPEVLDFNALLRNLETMLGRLIGEDIELELQLDADLGRVTADPGQIEQVVTNLVVNARDAMPLGGRLTIKTAAVELDETYARGHESLAPGRYALLAVTDTGCGMDKATLDRLFEPFFTTKPMGKGTGLGLATVYGIVKQSGGYIYAYSEPGQGTTFKIYLLRTDAQPAAKAAGAGAAAPPRGQGELILLVEDEAPLRELCETVLSGLGYRVSAVGRGTEALRLVQEQGCEPELVITDVIMPGMSGAELAERLRRERPDLKVLYMSGYPDDAIARHGVLAPGTPFVQKPFTERTLAAKVHETLGEKANAVDERAPVRPELVEGSAGKPFMLRQAQHERLTSTVSGKTAGQATMADGSAPVARRVLIIDDDEQYRELVGHFCAKRGHSFAGVDSAAAAIAALAESSFDVLLVDLNIPGTSGEQILREIRAAGHTAPAIILTGDVASADMTVLRPHGVTQTLEKSSNAAPLLRAIEAIAT